MATGIAHLHPNETGPVGYERRIVVSGRVLSAAWLNVWQAAEARSERVEWAAMRVEVFGDGLRLVASDGYLMLRSWVPFDADADVEEPGVDEIPLWATAAHDTHTRVAALLKHVRDQTRKPGSVDVPVTLMVAPAGLETESGQLALGADFVGDMVLVATTTEQVEVAALDDWVPWPTLAARATASTSRAGMNLSLGVLGRVARLAGVARADLRFTDAHLAVFTARGVDPTPDVHGLWALERDSWECGHPGCSVVIRDRYLDPDEFDRAQAVHSRNHEDDDW